MISRRRSVVFSLICAAAVLAVRAVEAAASLTHSVGRYVLDHLAPVSQPLGVLAKTFAQPQAELPGEKSRVMAMESGRVEMCRKHERWTACPST